MLAALRSGDEATARKLQDTAIKMIAICNGIGVTHLAASKALMPMLGVDTAPPGCPSPSRLRHRSHRCVPQLEAIGFFDFACRAPAQG